MFICMLIALAGTSSEYVTTCEQATKARLLRTGAVLVQEIANHAIDTPAARQWFERLLSLVPNGPEPYYDFGFLWQDDVERQLKASLVSGRYSDSEFGNGGGLFQIRLAFDETRKRLADYKGIRTISIPEQSDSKGDLALPDVMSRILEIVAETRDLRLLAALFVDAAELEPTRREAALAVFREWKPLDSVLRIPVPPGCGSHVVSWEFYVLSTQAPDRGATFRDLCDRLKLLCQTNPAQPRERALLRLEQTYPYFDIERFPFDQAVDAVASFAGIANATQWRAPGTDGPDAAIPVTAAAYKWEQVPVRVALDRVVTAGYHGRASWRVNDEGKIEVFLADPAPWNERLKRPYAHCGLAKLLGDVQAAVVQRGMIPDELLTGAETNYLLMNDGTVLVVRTAEWGEIIEEPTVHKLRLWPPTRSGVLAWPPEFGN